MKARKNDRRGFTLIEVILVIVILAMLAAVGIGLYGPIQDRERIRTTKLLVTVTVPGALDRYKLDIGHYPTEEEGGLEALWKKPSFDEEDTMGANWVGYVTQEPKDAWGKSLNYEIDEEAEGFGPKYKLWSNGPNGNSGDDDDITSEPAGEES